MKQVLCAVMLFLLSTMSFAQEEIPLVDLEEIAESVVMVVSLNRGQSAGVGSGTIMTADGLIYTNRHVIEVGSDYAIYMLDDVGDPPELRYFASLVGISDTIDFAILQIDRDADGRNINTDTLNLNTVPIADEPIGIGDEIRVFGFPGLSEGLLTVTSGEVVTVQNGSIYGERLPVWYWTDAEISSGNSGGLTVNAEGEFIGIPTWVRAEGRTASRLGGVLPYGTILIELGTSDQPIPRESTDVVGIDVELTVENLDDLPICYVNISETTADNWGEDRLDNDEIIEVGEIRSFTLPADYYDVQLSDCDGVVLNDVRNIDLTEDVVISHFDEFDSSLSRPVQDDSPILSGSEQVTVTIENRNATTICYVYISPSNAMEWGEDQLGDQEVIELGQTATFTIEPSIYDILLQDCDRELIDDAYELDLTEDTALYQEPLS